jgi:hypothetical protein
MRNSPTKNIIIFLLSISLMACASGSSIVTGNKRTPVDPDHVKLYTEYPEKYEVIGIVNASSDAGWSEQDSLDYAVQELKNQAALLGANGVVIESTGQNTYPVYGGYGSGALVAIPVTEKTISGKAIYVKKEK